MEALVPMHTAMAQCPRHVGESPRAGKARCPLMDARQKVTKAEYHRDGYDQQHSEHGTCSMFHVIPGFIKMEKKSVKVCVCFHHTQTHTCACLPDA